MAFSLERVRSASVGLVRRHFLGWDRPTTESAAHEIGRRFSVESSSVDLTRSHVIVPGSRFGGQLVSHLVRRHGSVLGQPVTIERFLETALPAAGRLASEWMRRCCYLAAVDELTDDQRDRLFPPNIAGSFARRLAIVASIDASATRLGGEGLSFADVLAVVENRGLPDVQRWSVLDRLHRLYLDRLHRLNLSDPAAERLAALARGPIVPHDIVLACLPEVPGLLRRVINRAQGSVLALVGAPPERGEAFDELGAVLSHAWQDHEVPIDDSIIRVVDGPDDQAEHALLFIGRDDPPRRPVDVVIAAPDDQTQHAIESLSLDLTPPDDGRAPIRVRPASGVPGDRSAPGRLLRLVGDFLSDPEFPAFAALVRHHAVEARIKAAITRDTPVDAGESRDFIAILDEYSTTHVHGVVDGRWLGTGRGHRAVLDAVYANVVELLGDLWSRDGPASARPASHWSSALVALLWSVFESDPDDATARACGEVERSCRELRAGSLLGGDEPHIAPSMAISLVLEALSRAAIRGPRDEGAVEIVGWLEAVYDPAPVLVLTGMNEGIVPRASSDGLLPDSLRAALGLTSRDSVLARDAYLLTQALAWRSPGAAGPGGPVPRALVIAARRSADGSRLW
ncbi:MAG TPA: hypothetical protein PKU91_06220, partial [Phycisphaerales bacterium]|nr:hypothetical protein [Phycisphaerales bacterium]